MTQETRIRGSWLRHWDFSWYSNREWFTLCFLVSSVHKVENLMDKRKWTKTVLTSGAFLPSLKSYKRYGITNFNMMGLLKKCFSNCYGDTASRPLLPWCYCYTVCGWFSKVTCVKLIKWLMMIRSDKKEETGRMLHRCLYVDVDTKISCMFIWEEAFSHIVLHLHVHITAPYKTRCQQSCQQTVEPRILRKAATDEKSMS